MYWQILFYFQNIEDKNELSLMEFNLHKSKIKNQVFNKIKGKEYEESKVYKGAVEGKNKK